ncbi:ABC-type transport auxiliary lipoprotein family protein [Methylosinus sp. Sm6]|uniref:ABC-type transport auxiliary lipoprotein family protein n=1 Tax=Methylosinus sp. Sm6 TaxID=2866948 RepID=UPI001C9978E6|nr:ABC-type transport auxiliary lipoprotein family protein [Methylosinus sp. Sm6]MBY6240260.1 ABC-type transport auxiliary lipoprotein family protein [Methylosinus sp. Sm6]
MTPSKAAPTALALALAVSACSGAPQRESFDLSSALGESAAARPLRRTLAVAEPHAIQPIDSDRIVIRTGPNGLANLAEAQWVDRLPRLVQARLIAAFDRGRKTGSVARPGQAAERILSTDIRRFEIDVSSGEAVVEIAAEILDARGVATGPGRIFSAQAPAEHSTGPAAVHALDEALASVLRQIVRWAASQG